MIQHKMHILDLIICCFPHLAKGLWEGLFQQRSSCELPPEPSSSFVMSCRNVYLNLKLPHLCLYRILVLFESLK